MAIADTTPLVEAFREFIDPQYVIADDETKRPFECDGLPMYRQMPMLVVLPETVGQVQRVMRICHERGVPVVARGAGTGLSAGAMPHADGVVLSLAKFNRILDIDPLARSARVQPGVRNLAISEAANEHGLYYAPDPSSQIACSIGGNVAENSGGVHCLKYGLTVHNLLSVELVTVDGELIRLGSRRTRLRRPGPDGADHRLRGPARHRYRSQRAPAAGAGNARRSCWPRSIPWKPPAMRSAR